MKTMKTKFIIVAVMCMLSVVGYECQAVTSPNVELVAEAVERNVHAATPLYFRACASGHTSIVDALKSIGANSSYSYRKYLASMNGIPNYRGSVSQNMQMLKLLKNGRMIRGYISCR